ncbi:hypothetical protein [Pandoraea apista]|uniref:hypothetical protein n=1 Tax=Pandoraea apista TaxID=93218 RepID=UPI000F6669AA|nr:hypothetical protein [Pandoraea apista]
MLKSLKKVVSKAIGFVVGAVASGVAMADPAAGPDFTSLTSSVNWGGVTTAVLALAAGLAAVYVGMRGAKMVLSMIKGR